MYGDNKILETSWDEQFELSDESYSVSNFQDFFEYVIKKHETLANKSPIQIYVNRIQNRITYKINSGYYHDFLTPENMKLLGSTERRITKGKNSKNMSQLEIIGVVLVHCNIVNNQY